MLLIRAVPVRVIGAMTDVQGKDGEKRQVYCVLNPSFVPESRVGNL